MLLSEIWKSTTSGLRVCARERKGSDNGKGKPGLVIVDTSESGFGSESSRDWMLAGERGEKGGVPSTVRTRKSRLG